MALRAARNAGIEVPKETIDRAVDFLTPDENTETDLDDLIRRYLLDDNPLPGEGDGRYSPSQAAAGRGRIENLAERVGGLSQYIGAKWREQDNHVEILVPLEDKRSHVAKVFIIDSTEPFSEGEPLLGVEADVGEGGRDEALDRVRLARGDDVVVGRLLLQHQPHRLDVVAGEAPVALGVQVADAQLLLHPELDAGHAVRDLAGHELETAARRLVVEEDAADRVEVEAVDGGFRGDDIDPEEGLDTTDRIDLDGQEVPALGNRARDLRVRSVAAVAVASGERQAERHESKYECTHRSTSVRGTLPPEVVTPGTFQ